MDQAPVTKPSNPKSAFGSRKVSLSVLPPIVLWEVSLGMMDGATKYGRYNWRGVGVRSSEYYDATQRHLTAFWEGQDIDPDSGLHHLTKAISSLVVWRDAMLRGMCQDDRPPFTSALDVRLGAMNQRAKELVESRQNLHPRDYTIEDTPDTIDKEPKE